METPLQILFIEDHAADFQLVERHVAKSGLPAVWHHVASREQLEVALGREDWDLVLSDYNVPTLPFDETLALLKPKLEALPLILVSGSVGEERAVELLKRGVWDFVLKDNLTRLVPAIQRSLRDAAERRTRRRVEDDLRESEEKFWQLAANITDAFWIASPDFKVLHYVSPAYERIWGRSIESLYAQPLQWIEAVQPEHQARVMAAFRSLSENVSVDIEYPIVRPDGTTRWIHDRGFAVRDAVGRLIRRAGIASDVTERKEAEIAASRLAAVVESSDDAIIGKDLNGMVIHWNKGAERIFGHSANEMLGGSITRLIPESLRAEEDFILGQIRQGGRVEHFETRRRTKDGREIDVSVTVSPIRDPAGNIVGASKVARDITERKLAENALRESERRFRLLFESSLDAILTVDPAAGKFTSGNPAALKLFGAQSEAELLACGPADLSPARQPDGNLSASRSREIDARVLREGSQFFEWSHQRLTGGQFLAEVLLTRVEWNGRPAIISTIRDITERRKAEEERLRLSTALEQAAESIVITDLHGMILYVNPAFEKITGYPRREAIGQNVKVLNSGKHEAAFFADMWSTIQRGEVWHGHFINKRKDGSLFEEDATISPVRDPSGRIVNYMAIKLDVTREMALQAQFRQAQKIEAIGQLADGVAHDFNNILTSILMQIALGSMEDGASGTIRECLEQIQRDAERAASLTRQLLLFSRRQVMQSRDLDLNDIVTNLAKMLQRIIGEDVRLQMDLHPLPLLTHADAGMLDQVLMNLAVNARDAMPQGGRLVIATAEKRVDAELARRQPDASPGRYVALRVTDNGCGIPAEVLPQIFEPFFTTKEVGKGTGLGLATVFGIVKQHGGWITVETKLGFGTTFEVFLPAIKVQAVAEAEARPAPRGGTETILLVEDEQIVRRSLRNILQRSGYHVLEAASGDDALRLWADSGARVALLLTDLVMPGTLTGQQLARQLKTERPDLKVVFTSGYSAEIAGREINLAAGEAFLQKPLLPEELLRILRHCLDGLM